MSPHISVCFTVQPLALAAATCVVFTTLVSDAKCVATSIPFSTVGRFSMSCVIDLPLSPLPLQVTLFSAVFLLRSSPVSLLLLQVSVSSRRLPERSSSVSPVLVTLSVFRALFLVTSSCSRAALPQVSDSSADSFEKSGVAILVLAMLSDFKATQPSMFRSVSAEQLLTLSVSSFVRPLRSSCVYVVLRVRLRYCSSVFFDGSTGA